MHTEDDDDPKECDCEDITLAVKHSKILSHISDIEELSKELTRAQGTAGVAVKLGKIKKIDPTAPLDKQSEMLDLLSQCVKGLDIADDKSGFRWWSRPFLQLTLPGSKPLQVLHCVRFGASTTFRTISKRYSVMLQRNANAYEPVARALHASCSTSSTV